MNLLQLPLRTCGRHKRCQRTEAEKGQYIKEGGLKTMRPVSLTFIPRLTLEGIIEQPIGTTVKKTGDRKQPTGICKKYIKSDRPNFLLDKVEQVLDEKAVVDVI